MATLFHPRNRSSFYHRAIVPRCLRLYFKGRAQLWRSLSTNNRDDATLKALAWQTRAHRLFVTLKRHGATMTAAQIERLIAQWMDSELEETEDYRAVHPVTDDYQDGVQQVLSTQFDETEEALSECNYSLVASDADRLLQASGLPLLPHASTDFKRLCRRLLLAKQDVLRIESDRWNGVYTPRPPAPVPSDRSAAPSSAELSPATASKPFSEVVGLYFKENPRATRTDAQIKAEFEKFLAVLGGDRPMASITKAECRTYKEHILKDRTQATCIKHLSSLAGLFKWAEQQGFTPDGFNPVRGLSPNKRHAKKQGAQRRPFTDAELRTVLGSQEFKRQRETHPERYWLVLLCVFQVCRREEAGQLNLADLGTADGIPFLTITDEGEGQGLKNQGSKRRLPIHSSLVQLGFLEYVEQIKQANHPRLFPHLKKGANGYSDAVGKFFSRLVTKAGLTDPALVLHSLRHGGITKLHAAGVAVNLVEVLAGHSANTVHGQVYVHREGLPLSLLQEGLEKLRYDDVVKALAEGGPHA